jgi:hypothetical protein
MIVKRLLMEDTMKSATFLAALIGVAFAAASVSSTFAQSSAPGTTPPRPNKVTAVPPPPPPGGPDKLVSQTRPKDPGARVAKPRTPTVVDDFAPHPDTLPSTCYSTLGIQYFNCVASLVTICVNGGGSISYTDRSFTCTISRN